MFKNKFSKKLRKNIRETPSLWWRNYHFLGNIIFHFFCIFDFPLFLYFYLDIYIRIQMTLYMHLFHMYIQIFLLAPLLYLLHVFSLLFLHYILHSYLLQSRGRTKSFHGLLVINFFYFIELNHKLLNLFLPLRGQMVELLWGEQPPLNYR